MSLIKIAAQTGAEYAAKRHAEFKTKAKKIVDAHKKKEKVLIGAGAASTVAAGTGTAVAMHKKEK